MLNAQYPIGRASAQGAPVGFGMDLGSVDQLGAAGSKPDYATMWIGPWTLASGWGGPNAAVDNAVAKDVTPIIQYYYWGDDISQNCIQNGCYSNLHKAMKTQDGWQTLASQLVDNLNAHLNGRPVVIILETEFNKNDVAAWEPFDAMLAEKADYFHARIPGAKVVLGFGNWNSAAWGTFDRAAAASDYVGIQGMRGSTRQNANDYMTLASGLVDGARKLQALFHKPVLVTDVALSSYPEPDYLQRQADALQLVFDALPDLKAAGVEVILYRSWRDTPTMDTANYYGMAERYWGFTRPSDGSSKPAAQVWIDGVNAERGAPAAPTPSAASDPPTSASASPSPSTSSAAPTTPSAPAATSSAAPKTAAPTPTSTSAAAPTPGPSAWQKEAESFGSRPVGGRVASGSASGGAIWNLWSNGAVSDTMRAAKDGPYELRLDVAGTPLGGVWPTLQVRVDGKTVAEQSVGGSWTTVRVPLQLSQGSHALAVAFTNDARNNREDRNLLFDDATLVPLVRHEAEAFPTQKAGGRQSDGTASGGARWNLWSNGYVEDVASLPAGPVEIRVRAQGEMASGVAPHMVVLLDGAKVLDASPGPGWGDYTARSTVAAGSHTLRIVFDNDVRTSKEDRNLLVDSVDWLSG